MIVFITTGYNENVIGGSDLWVSNFIENIFPLIKEPFALLIDGRPYVNRKEDFYKLYTFDNDGKVDALLDSADKIVFLHHSYKSNPIIKKYLHKIHTTFVHAFIPDMLKLNSDYENIMTKLDWEWQKDILDNSDNIVWIGYENDTIHKTYPHIINITNYYEWKQSKPFLGIISNRIGYAARCETRKNAHYLDNQPSIIFSNKYDYKRMLEGSKINSEYHRFMEEPFGYSIFDAVDNGKVPIIHTDWMKHINYKYRANTKSEFNHKYLQILEDSFDVIDSEFCKLRSGLTEYTNKQKWVTEICKVLSI